MAETNASPTATTPTPATETAAAPAAAEAPKPSVSEAAKLWAEQRNAPTTETKTEAEKPTEEPKVETEEKQPESLRVIAKKEQKARKALEEATALQKTLQDKEQTIAQREQVLSRAKDEFITDPFAYGRALGLEFNQQQLVDWARVAWADSGDPSCPASVREYVKQLRQENRFKRYDSIPSEEELLKKAEEKAQQTMQEQARQASLIEYQNKLVHHIDTSLDNFPHIAALAKANPEVATGQLMNFAYQMAGDERVLDLAFVAQQFEDAIKQQISIYGHLYAPKTEEANKTTEAPPTANTQGSGTQAAKPAVEPKPTTLTNSNTSIQPARGKPQLNEREMIADAARLMREAREQGNL